MSKRTYKEAVKLMVNWWVEKSFKIEINQNNGDSSSKGAIAFFLMNLMSKNAKKDITNNKIKKFKSKLTEILLANENEERYLKQLEVDYHPNKILNDSCEYSGINTSCLPCKTFTFINSENEIQGRFQYGGDWFKL